MATMQELRDALTAAEVRARGRLIDLIENTDELTATLQQWLRIPLDHQLHQHELRPPTGHERSALRLHDGTHQVLARAGVLCAAIPASTQLVVAHVSAIVARQRLPRAARGALDQHELPLGALLRRYSVRRHTHVADPVDDLDATGGRQLLKVSATLTLPGQGRVAIVEEIIYLAVLRPSQPSAAPVIPSPTTGAGTRGGRAHHLLATPSHAEDSVRASGVRV